MSHDKQHTLCLLTAMSAPLALCAGCGWGTVLLAGVLLLPLSCLPRRWEGMGKSLRILQAVWMGLVLGSLLRYSAEFWPSHEGKAVPLVLLALAFCTTGAAASRVGAVLGFCLLVLYLPVAAAGAMQLEPGWLQPAFGEWTWLLPLILLLPALLGGEKPAKVARWTGLVGVALAIMTQGILSPWVAGSVDTPFYQMARTLSPGGISHIEPVISIAVTLGWFALAAGILGRTEGKADRILTSAAAAGIILLDARMEGIWMVISSVILWVALPFVRYKIFFKKSEKRC